MGESVALSAHLREANISQQNKNPQRTAEHSISGASAGFARCARHTKAVNLQGWLLLFCNFFPP